MNTPEMLNREIKASKMARACFDAGITVDELSVATAEDWQMLADAAGCKPPNSKDTVDRVLALLEQAYADAAVEGPENPDSQDILCQRCQVKIKDGRVCEECRAEEKWEEQQMEGTRAGRILPA
jgi:hypothetical protein